MKPHYHTILRVLLGIFLLIAPLQADDPASYVDPAIGNISKLLVPTYPTFHLPNQMLRMFPIRNGYLDDQITAFPLQVVSHRSAGIMRLSVSTGPITADTWNRRMSYDQDLESLHPWLYSTYLIDDDISLSFTPGQKCAIYRITFPAGASHPNLLLKGARPLTPKVLSDGAFTLQEPIQYTTRGTKPQTRLMAAWCYGRITDQNGAPLKNLQFDSKSNRLAITLPADAPRTIQLKYAISYISPEQARDNFDHEIAAANFDTLAGRGRDIWNRRLSQIQLVGGTDSQKRTFYTSLYRTFERMVNINENGQYYSGYDNQVHRSDAPFYIDDWVWDSYRAHHPLRVILDPETETHILDSYVQMYRQSGWMPTFPQVYGNSMCMNCFHSSAIFLDAYRKGLRGFDLDTAYEGIKKNLTQATMLPWRQGTPKRAIDDFFYQHGYIPALRPGEKETDPMVDRFEKRQAVAVTLGISYDSWVLSQLADELKKTNDIKIFAQRAQNFRKLWNSDKKLFMPKDMQGRWIDIDPKFDGGPGGRDYYDENNGWTYAWQVPHDLDALIELLGGSEAACERLDQMFREPLGRSRYAFNAVFPDSTCMVGQFSMGNEPSFHIPYLYNYFGAPWKTQQRIRFLLDVWFKDTPMGIPGDEDGGGMTAFVVFSQLGFYPVVPGLPYYTIGSPVFEKAAISLPDSKTFTILAPGASRRNKYIQKAFLNDQPLDAPFFTHQDLISGATLKLIMGDTPNKHWGTHVAPPFK